MIEWTIGFLESLTASPWFLAALFAVAFIDAVVPVVPSETAVIIGGVAAGFGELPFLAVAAVGAAGAIGGDVTAYQLGTSFGDLLHRRAGPRWCRRIDWARAALTRRAGTFLVAARFIPGGRSAITITSGITRYPRIRFVAFITLAGLVWATFAASLGFFFGRRFQQDHTLAFLAAFGTALAIVATAELIRFGLRRRRTTI